MDNNEDYGRNDSRDRLDPIEPHTQWDLSFLSQLSEEELIELLSNETTLEARASAHEDAAVNPSRRIRLRFLRREIIRRSHLLSTHDAVEAPRIQLPPRLIYDGLLQRLLSPGAYKRYIVPHVADMHDEYFACLAKGDEAGARWAVIRGHLYVIPSWVWSLLGQVLARVLGKRI